MTSQRISSDAKGVSSGLNHWWKLAVGLAAELIPPLGEWRRHAAKKYQQLAVEAYSAGNLSMATAHLMAAIERDSRNPGYYGDLGQTYYAAGDYVKAKEQYTIALRHNYTDLRALKGLGYSHHALGEYAEAIYLYLKYLEQNASDADLLFNLGVALHNSEKYTEAVEYYTKAEELDPDNAFVPENRGRALYALGRINESIASLRRALELNPANAEAHRFIGIALEAKGEKDRASESYVRALELDPANGDAHIDLSRLLRQQDRYEDSVQHDIQALRIFEEQGDKKGLAWTYTDLGWDYYKLGSWAKSIEASRNALQLQPALFYARFNLALALLHDNQQKDALEEYRRGVEDVILASDLTQFAIDDLRDALQTRPDLPGAAEILHMLERRYDELGKDHGLPSIASSSAAS